MSESSQAVKDLFGYGFTSKEEPKFGDFEDDLDKKHAEYLCETKSIPPLKIVMLIVGTRGDVQPFIAIGKRLQVTSIVLLFAHVCANLLILTMLYLLS